MISTKGTSVSAGVQGDRSARLARGAQREEDMTVAEKDPVLVVLQLTGGNDY